MLDNLIASADRAGCNLWVSQIVKELRAMRAEIVRLRALVGASPSAGEGVIDG